MLMFNDLYCFIRILVALIVAECYKVSREQNPVGLILSHSS